MLPERPILPLPRWLAPLALICVIVLVPWIVYLGLTLPTHARANHYDVAWIGFDCAMCVVLAALAYCAIRRSTMIEIVAAVAATMLFMDAWFDIVTAPDRRQLIQALFLALVTELPLAVVCAWTAVNAERLRLRRYQDARGYLSGRPETLPRR